MQKTSFINSPALEGSFIFELTTILEKYWSISRIPLLKRPELRAPSVILKLPKEIKTFQFGVKREKKVIAKTRRRPETMRSFFFKIAQTRARTKTTDQMMIRFILRSL